MARRSAKRKRTRPKGFQRTLAISGGQVVLRPVTPAGVYINEAPERVPGVNAGAKLSPVFAPEHVFEARGKNPRKSRAQCPLTKARINVPMAMGTPEPTTASPSPSRRFVLKNGFPQFERMVSLECKRCGQRCHRVYMYKSTVHVAIDGECGGCKAKGPDNFKEIAQYRMMWRCYCGSETEWQRRRPGGALFSHVDLLFMNRCRRMSCHCAANEAFRFFWEKQQLRGQRTIWRERLGLNRWRISTDDDTRYFSSAWFPKNIKWVDLEEATPAQFCTRAP